MGEPARHEDIGRNGVSVARMAKQEELLREWDFSPQRSVGRERWYNKLFTLELAYTSRSRIFLKERAGHLPVIVWDDRYFAYVTKTLLLSITMEIRDVMPRKVAALCHALADRWISIDPWGSIVFRELGSFVRQDAGIVHAPAMPTLNRYASKVLSVMKEFCLLHEIGHIVIRRPETLTAVAEQFKNATDAVEKVKDFYARHDEAGPIDEALGFDPHTTIFRKLMDPEYELDYSRRFLDASNTSKIKAEVFADIFAISEMVALEIEHVLLELPKAQGAKERNMLVERLILIPEAMVILHYIQSDLILFSPNFMEAKPHSERSAARQKRYLESHEQNRARGNLRIALAYAMIQGTLDQEPPIKSQHDERLAIVLDYGDMLTLFSDNYRYKLVEGLDSVTDHIDDFEHRMFYAKLRKKYSHAQALEICLRTRFMRKVDRF